MLIICPIAGVGSRLIPLTKNKPKIMLKVAGKRIIDHLMDKIIKTFPKGSTFCFIVGYQKELVVEYLKTHYQYTFNLKFVEQQSKGFKKSFPFYSGLGDAISLAADYGRNKDCFILLSDRYPLEEYTPLIESQWSGCINSQLVTNPQHYGIIVPNSDGTIKKIVEKPSDFISNIAVSGAYYFRSNITTEMFDMLEVQAEKEIIDYNEHDFTSIIQKLVNNGHKFGYHLMERPVLDFGRPNNLLQANKALITENIKNMGDSELNVEIGKECRIINSEIGNYTSIGDNTTIDNCTIENSIIGDNCNLRGLIFKNAILDDNSTNGNLQEHMIQL